MSLIFDILYAAHASGTHHKLAMDALKELRCGDADDWQRYFLSQAKTYVTGSKAPDDVFKDFTNHVLHVRDNYWGGAPAKAEIWYQELVSALKAQSWSDAAFAAGVLSHYVSDPLMPFHTAQSEAENNIHAPTERTVSKTYGALKALAATMTLEPVEVGQGPQWLRELVIHGAEASNPHYEALIAHFDFNRAVVDPTTGLDSVGQKIVAQMLARARTAISIVLDRAIAEAAVAPPQVNLTAQAVLATLNMPIKYVTKKIEDATERNQIEAMYDELQATGRVVTNLRDDERTVSAAHAAEVAAKTIKARAEARAAAVKQTTPKVEPAAAIVATEKPAPTPAAAKERIPVVAPPEPVAEIQPVAPSTPVPPAEAVVSAVAKLVAVASENRASPVAEPAHEMPDEDLHDAGPTPFHLTSAHDVVHAPSIGPKTAARLYAAGVHTVGDLFCADPGALSEQLNTGWITARIVRDWQDQARLMVDVPGLRATHTQLLVGAGIRSAAKLATSDGHALLAAVLKFAGTSDGHRVLREGVPPDIGKVLSWIEYAKAREAA